MKNHYTCTILENQTCYTSSQLWRFFAFILLCLMLHPAAGIQANAQTNNNTDRLTVTIENAFSSGWIHCNNEKVTLVAVAYLNGVRQNPENFSFSWVGPGGFKATGTRIDVTVAGEYELTVQNASGLSASEKYLVRGVAGAAGTDKVLRTSEPSVELSADSSPWTWFGFTPSWTASDGGNIVSGADTFTPSVDAPGTYTLTLTHTSGCTMEDQVIVTAGEDVFIARIADSMPEIDCEGNPTTLTPYITLNGKEVKEDIAYNWTGPNDYASDARIASVTEPGIYTLEATHLATGLTSTATKAVSQLRFPEGSAGPDKVLTCDNPTVTLEGSITNDFGHPIWLASDGGNFVSGYRTLNPVVDAPGTYTLILQHPKGCRVEYTVKVTRDEGPAVSATGGRLDCATGTVQLTGSSDREGVTYSWTGPNGYTSTEQNPTVKVAGDYTLTVTDPETGCTASTNVVVTPASTELEVKNHLIDFEGEKKGLITSINTEAGPVALIGRKRNPDGSYAPENHAAIFNSQNPTADDANLYTVDWGEVLIINQYQNNVPDANQWGGELILDFSAIGPVTMESIKVVGMDHYEHMSWVYLYDGDGKELHKEYIKPLGLNSKQTVNLGNTRGVVQMKVVFDGRDGSKHFAGSGAINDIKFHQEKTLSAPCETEAESITHAIAYPTEFSDNTKIDFIVRETKSYTLSLYDTQGLLVQQLKEGTARAGEMTSVEVDGRNLKEGMYIARLVTDSGTKTFKLILKR